jgi:hypothetical protein
MFPYIEIWIIKFGDVFIISFYDATQLTIFLNLEIFENFSFCVSDQNA